MLNRDAIESLRSFAFSHNEIAFTHLCTAALADEEWAVNLLDFTTSRIALVCADAGKLESHEFEALQLRVISEVARDADTWRTDGLTNGVIARSLEF